MGATSENPVRNHYFHAPERLQEHKADLDDQARNPLIPREGNGERVVAMQRIAETEKSRKRRGVVYEGQRAGGEQGRKPDIRASREGLAPTYEVVNTLKQAAEKTGIPLDEILTTRDIQDEWNINRVRIHEWTRRGPHGEPHLTPLPVRLRGGSGGGQLLFRRGDIESKVANPPKPGRPWK
jgi:hypothetical protein